MPLNRFFAKLDVHWIRLLVCLLPGLVLTKLAATFGNPSAFSKIALAVLMIGAAIYMFWKRIRGRVFGLEDVDAQGEFQEAVELEEEMSGQEHAGMVAELLSLCEGDAAKVLSLIRTETELHAEFTYGDAIEAALARRVYETQ